MEVALFIIAMMIIITCIIGLVVWLALLLTGAAVTAAAALISKGESNENDKHNTSGTGAGYDTHRHNQDGRLYSIHHGQTDKRDSHTGQEEL